MTRFLIALSVGAMVAAGVTIMEVPSKPLHQVSVAVPDPPVAASSLRQRSVPRQ